MIENLLLNENAYFYSIEPSSIDNEKIDELFTDIMSVKKVIDVINKTIREEYDYSTTNFVYSLLIFNYRSNIDFIKLELGDYEEIKYAYILIIEVDNKLIISKRNVSNLEKLYDWVESIDYQILAKGFIDVDSAFLKFSMRNMDISDTAVRSKIIESSNLKNSISILSANRYLLKNAKIRTGESTFSLSLSNSRVNKIGKKQDADAFFEWMFGVLEKIDNFSDHETFVDIFASPISFVDVRDSLNPIACLVSFDSILEDIENGNIVSVQYKETVENIVEIDIEAFRKKLEVENRSYAIHSVNQDYIIENSFDDKVTLKKNPKSFSIKGPKLSKLFLNFEDGSKIDLIKYLNREKCYILTFSNPQQVYFNGVIFEDKKLLNNVDRLLTVFSGQKELAKCTSEKGVIRSNSLNFSPNSIFGFIDKKYKEDPNCISLVCDDLGDEWADFIAIKNNSVSFYHAKSGDEGISASNFHDVVSQALKNIGNFYPDEERWEHKKRGWQESYKLKNVQSKIVRLRKGLDVDSFVSNYKEYISYPNIRKEINLVVNFISKQDLSDRLQTLKNTGTCTRVDSTIQLLWLISSFVAVCDELNIDIKVLCRE